MKNILLITVILLAFTIACKKDSPKKTDPKPVTKDTILVKFPSSLKFFEKNSNDVAGFQLSFRDSINKRTLYCYGDFNKDKTPKNLHSMSIKADGSDTVFHYTLNRYLQVDYCYYSIKGINSNEVLHFDYVSDLGNNVVLHQYNWETKEDVPIHISNIRRDGANYSVADTFLFNTSSSLSKLLSIGKSRVPKIKIQSVARHPHVSVITQNTFFNDLQENRKKFFDRFAILSALLNAQEKGSVFADYKSFFTVFSALRRNNATITKFNAALASVERPDTKLEMTYSSESSPTEYLLDTITSADLVEKVGPVPFILRDGVITKEPKNERGYDYYAVVLNATLFVQRNHWTWQASASKKDTVFDIPYLSVKHKMTQGEETFDWFWKSMQMYSGVRVPPNFEPLFTPWGGYGNKSENLGGYIKVSIKMNINSALLSDTFSVSNIPGPYEVRFGVTAMVGSTGVSPILADYGKESNAININYFENSAQ